MSFQHLKIIYILSNFGANMYKEEEGVRGHGYNVKDIFIQIMYGIWSQKVLESPVNLLTDNRGHNILKLYFSFTHTHCRSYM